MEKILEKYKHKYPNSVKYIEDNLTDLRCFRCGSPLLKEPEPEEYPYQCFACDENMFSFEAIKNDTALTDNEVKNMLEYVLRELKLDSVKN